MTFLVRQPHDHERQRSEERAMLLRHVIPNYCAPFAFHAITHASKTLDGLLAGVKGRHRPCHDSAAIMGRMPTSRGSKHDQLNAFNN